MAERGTLIIKDVLGEPWAFLGTSEFAITEHVQV